VKIVGRDRGTGTIVVECPDCKTQRPVDARSVQRASSGISVILTCPGCGTDRELPADLAEGERLSG
jgi:RNase P subunit RPR2